MEPLKWDPASLKEGFQKDEWLTYYRVEPDYTDISTCCGIPRLDGPPYIPASTAIAAP